MDTREVPFYKSLEYWTVTDEFTQCLSNYVIRGFHPGSFFEACFANDLLGAAQHSHVLNTWPVIIQMMKWLDSEAPEECFGSHEHVRKWLQLPQEERIIILEDKGLLYTEEQAVWHALSTE